MKNANVASGYTLIVNVNKHTESTEQTFFLIHLCVLSNLQLDCDQTKTKTAIEYLAHPGFESWQLNSPQTDEAAWINSKPFLPYKAKKEVQLP